MARHSRDTLLFFLGLLIFLVPFLLGQDASTGAIRGTVVDASGSRISGALVALVSSATGFRYSVNSDAAGQFAFEMLPPGDYSGRAVAAG